MSIHISFAFSDLHDSFSYPDHCGVHFGGCLHVFIIAFPYLYLPCMQNYFLSTVDTRVVVSFRLGREQKIHALNSAIYLIYLLHRIPRRGQWGDLAVRIPLHYFTLKTWIYLDIPKLID